MTASVISPALHAALAHPIDSYGLPGGEGRAAIAQVGATPDELAAVGNDPSCPAIERLAAFEGWVGLVGENALGAVDDATATAMASAQVEAIRGADEGDPWSMPSDVTSSHVSRHLIVLGRRVLPVVKPLLDDTRELPYSGGEGAAIASLRKYRVCDLAAAIIATITGVPYDNAKDPAKRDKQIAALK